MRETSVTGVKLGDLHSTRRVAFLARDEHAEGFGYDLAHAERRSYPLLTVIIRRGIIVPVETMPDRENIEGVTWHAGACHVARGRLMISVITRGFQCRR